MSIPPTDTCTSRILARSRKLRDANLPLSCFYLIAAPSTPDEARDEILERAETGERVPVAEAKKIIKAHKRAKPAKKSNAVKNRKTRSVAPKYIALCEFNEKTLRLVQMTRGQKPDRFAKTTVAPDELERLGEFLINVAMAKRAGAL